MRHPDNLKRAEWGRQAVAAFAMAYGGGHDWDETDVQDLISNLMHLCEVEGWGARDVVRRASEHFDYETSPLYAEEMGPEPTL